MDNERKLAEQSMALRSAAREFTKHTGPGVTADGLEMFARDLEAAALRYARAYYAQAREFGLIPESSKGG